MRFKLSVLAMVSMLGVGYATVAAQPQGGAQPQRDVQNVGLDDDRDEGGMDLGWLGLIGLTGLFGMKRSADNRNRAVVGDHTPSHVSR